MAHLLRLAIINRTIGWTCTSAGRAGETPVGGVFIKQRCEGDARRHMTIEAHFCQAR
jgi:hypothetical protein